MKIRRACDNNNESKWQRKCSHDDLSGVEESFLTRKIFLMVCNNCYSQNHLKKKDDHQLSLFAPEGSRYWIIALGSCSTAGNFHLSNKCFVSSLTRFFKVIYVNFFVCLLEIWTTGIISRALIIFQKEVACIVLRAHTALDSSSPTWVRFLWCFISSLMLDFKLVI